MQTAIELQDPRNIKLGGTTQQLLTQVTESLESLDRLRPFSQSIADRIRTDLLPDRVTASLNMEGIIATRRQTLSVMDALRIGEAIGRGQWEIANALRADEFVYDMFERAIPISEQLIRQVNGLLLDSVVQDAGSYRTSVVELPGAPFAPPLPTAVPPLVAQLCQWFPLADASHAILQAAWIHAQFTLIHPFVDGNGRTGRLLQDYALLKRGLLPIGIPPAERDDYYSALEKADLGNWDDLVEMLGNLQLGMIARTEAIAKEPERRTAWVQRLAQAAAQKSENTRHKNYLVWRQRVERLSRSFRQAAAEIDASSPIIGATYRDFGAVDFESWQEICRSGHIEKSWVFSLLFFAEGQAFYKAIAYVRRHRRQLCDFLPNMRDAVSIYFTGVDVQTDQRPDFAYYNDPHIRLREVLFIDDRMFVYSQASPDEQWRVTECESLEDVIEEFYFDVFARKAGLAV